MPRSDTSSKADNGNNTTVKTSNVSAKKEKEAKKSVKKTTPLKKTRNETWSSVTSYSWLLHLFFILLSVTITSYILSILRNRGIIGSTRDPSVKIDISYTAWKEREGPMSRWESFALWLEKKNDVEDREFSSSSRDPRGIVNNAVAHGLQEFARGGGGDKDEDRDGDSNTPLSDHTENEEVQSSSAAAAAASAVVADLEVQDIEEDSVGKMASITNDLETLGEQHTPPSDDDDDLDGNDTESYIAVNEDQEPKLNVEDEPPNSASTGQRGEQEAHLNKPATISQTTTLDSEKTSNEEEFQSSSTDTVAATAVAADLEVEDIDEDNVGKITSTRNDEETLGEQHTPPPNDDDDLNGIDAESHVAVNDDQELKLHVEDEQPNSESIEIREEEEEEEEEEAHLNNPVTNSQTVIPDSEKTSDDGDDQQPHIKSIDKNEDHSNVVPLDGVDDNEHLIPHTPPSTPPSDDDELDGNGTESYVAVNEDQETKLNVEDEPPNSESVKMRGEEEGHLNNLVTESQTTSPDSEKTCDDGDDQNPHIKSIDINEEEDHSNDVPLDSVVDNENLIPHTPPSTTTTTETNQEEEEEKEEDASVNTPAIPPDKDKHTLTNPTPKSQLEIAQSLLPIDPLGAEMVCDVITKQQPDNIDAWICLGEARLLLYVTHFDVLRGGDLEDDRLRLAQLHFETATSLNPMHTRARANLGITLLLSRSPPSQTSLLDAMMHLTTSHHLSSTTNTIHFASIYNTALIQLSLHRPVTAIPLLRRAVAIWPDFLSPRLNLASALLTVGYTAQAIEELQSLIRRVPCHRHTATPTTASYYDVDKWLYPLPYTDVRMQYHRSQSRLCSLLYNNLGIAHEKTSGSLESCLVYYQMALDFDEGNRAAGYNYNQLLSKMSSVDAEDHDDGSSSSGSDSGDITASPSLQSILDTLEHSFHRSQHENSMEYNTNARIWIGIVKIKIHLGDVIGAVQAATKALEYADGSEEFHAANRALEQALKLINDNDHLDDIKEKNKWDANDEQLNRLFHSMIHLLEQNSEQKSNSAHGHNDVDGREGDDDEVDEKAAMDDGEMIQKDIPRTNNSGSKKKYEKLVEQRQQSMPGKESPFPSPSVEERTLPNSENGSSANELEQEDATSSTDTLPLSMGEEQTLQKSEPQHVQRNDDVLSLTEEQQTPEKNHSVSIDTSQPLQEAIVRESMEGERDGDTSSIIENIQSLEETDSFPDDASMEQGPKRDPSSFGDAVQSVQDAIPSDRVDEDEGMEKTPEEDESSPTSLESRSEEEVPLDGPSHRGNATKSLTDAPSSVDTSTEEMQDDSLATQKLEIEEDAELTTTSVQNVSEVLPPVKVDVNATRSTSTSDTETQVADNIEKEEQVTEIEGNNDEASQNETNATANDQLNNLGRNETELKKGFTLPTLYNPPLEEAEELSSVAKGYMKMADAYMDKDNYKLASKQFQSVMKKHPNYLPAYIGYATALERMKFKDVKPIAWAYGNATSLALRQGDGGPPDSSRREGGMGELILRRAVDVARGMKQVRERVDALRALSALAHTAMLASDIYYCIGSELLENGLERDALSSFEISNALAATYDERMCHGKSSMELGRVSLRKGDSKRALRYLEAAANMDYDDLEDEEKGELDRLLHHVKVLNESEKR